MINLTGLDVTRCPVLPVSAELLPGALEWQRAAHDAGHAVLFDSRETVRGVFQRGTGLCAVVGGVPIGYVLFSAFTGEVRTISMVEVHPWFRRQGVAARLMAAAEGNLRDSGAQCIDVECASSPGEALCRFLGYEDHQDDSRNYRGPYANPTLRKYLTDWRPKERHPWA